MILGSIDGTHIRINPPRSGKDQYYNRKCFFSLHLQGVCNQNKKFIDIFTGYPGSVHDSRVFQNSPISKKLRHLCKDQYILGDSAYTCQQNLITPYRDHGNLSTAAKNFNHRLSQCRVDIENTFGILKQRIRQLYYCKLQGIEYLCHFIRACCVLHNLSGLEELTILNVNLEYNNSHNSSVHDNEISLIQDSELGRAIRNKICSELPPK